MRKLLRSPSESLDNVNRARVYREHGTKVRDLLSEASLAALKSLR